MSNFSSPCRRQSELLPSLVVCRPLTFHILIFETSQPNELKLGIFLLTEEKIFLEINQSETRIACGSHVC
jgi:hypothetical protein